MAAPDWCVFRSRSLRILLQRSIVVAIMQSPARFAASRPGFQDPVPAPPPGHKPVPAAVPAQKPLSIDGPSPYHRPLARGLR
jgi:hypothetical protein